MSGWWEIARVSGLLLFVTSTVTVVLGATATRRGNLERQVLLALVHRSAALATVALLVVHVMSVVVDSYVDVSPLAVVVPFTSGYSPFAVGLGALALWCLVVLVVTGLVRSRFAANASAARSWRGIHLVAWVMWLLTLAHGLLVGSDTGDVLAWIVYPGCVAAVVIAASVRLAAGRREVTIVSARRRARELPRAMVGDSR